MTELHTLYRLVLPLILLLLVLLVLLLLTYMQHLQCCRVLLDNTFFLHGPCPGVLRVVEAEAKH